MELLGALIVAGFLLITNLVVFFKMPFDLGWKKQFLFFIGVIIYQTFVGIAYGLVSEIWLNNVFKIESYSFFILHLLSLIQIYIILVSEILGKFGTRLSLFKKTGLIKILLITFISVFQLLVVFGLVEFR